jgi:hypothetical protein
MRKKSHTPAFQRTPKPRLFEEPVDTELNRSHWEFRDAIQ